MKTTKAEQVPLSASLIGEIGDVIRSSDMTLSEVARKVGVPFKQLDRWIREHEPLRIEVEAAQKERRACFVAAARASLMKRLKGYSYTESRRKYAGTAPGDGEDGGKVLLEEVKVTRHIAPDAGLITFTLSNLDGDTFNRQGGSDTLPDAAGGLSRGEAKALADRVLAGDIAADSAAISKADTDID